MKPILVSSCHKCNPQLWTVIGDSYGEYICQICGKLFKKSLERTKNETFNIQTKTT